MSPSRLAALILSLLWVWGPASAADYRLLRIDGVNLKWGETRMGRGAEVTWGFATVDAAFPDAINCRRLAPMADLAPACALAG